MTVEEILNISPDLKRISFNILSETLFDKFRLLFDGDKTWGEMGLDDELDQIEYVMELEKKLGIQISDEVIESTFGLNVRPVDFISYLRQRKINDLGI